MKYFKLPDLGEGLQEAEIVEWQVEVGDSVTQDQILVSVETAKAIVDLPSPWDGEIVKLYGRAGDILHIDDPLVEFASPESNKAETGTVVGKVEVGDSIIKEAPIALGRPTGVGVKATPAVRALATRLNVDLAIVAPSGKNGTITVEDVHRASKSLSDAGEMVPLRGVRRAMALAMSQAHSQVVPVTLIDDADIARWNVKQDISIRLIRAIIAGCKAETSLNAWYDSHAVGRTLLNKINIGVAVDTDQGLFVPVLRDVANRKVADLRNGLDAMKKAVRNRSIPPEELRGASITLSNFGKFAGRYANPIVIPPTVSILAAGKIHPEMVAETNGSAQVHNKLPLSLTFDHRTVTGGEAARFLAAAINDLEKSK